LVSDTQGGSELRKSFPNHITKFSELSLKEMKDLICAPRLPTGNLTEFNTAVTQMWNEVISENFSFTDSGLKRLEINGESEVTVVVITKDRPKFLKQALRSIAAQTHLPSEVIIVEDVTNSSIGEDLGLIFEGLNINLHRVEVDYSDHKFHSRTGVLLSGQNKAAKSRNLGLGQVKTKYVAFLDDDNLFKPHHLQVGLKKLYEQSVDVVSSYMDSVTSKHPLDLGSRNEQTIIMAGDQFGLLNWLSNVTLDSQIIAKTKTLIEVGGFPEDTTPEDWGLGLKLMNAGVRVGCSRIPTVVYRKNVDGIQAKLVADAIDWHRLDSQAPKLSNNLGPTWWVTRLIGASTGTQTSDSQFGTLNKSTIRTLIKIGIKAALKGEFNFVIQGLKKTFRIYRRSK
jgi:cellulose synthase/poly-beta-1,6-N-acetylglucosamine synthase-like glycosyltransferase